MKDIISAKQLGKTYGDLTVLKGVDLNIKRERSLRLLDPLVRENNLTSNSRHTSQSRFNCSYLSSN